MLELAIVVSILLAFIKLNRPITTLADGVETGLNTIMKTGTNKLEEFSIDVDIQSSKNLKKKVAKINKLDTVYTGKDVRRLLKAKRANTASAESTSSEQQGRTES